MPVDSLGFPSILTYQDPSGSLHLDSRPGTTPVQVNFSKLNNANGPCIQGVSERWPGVTHTALLVASLLREAGLDPGPFSCNLDRSAGVSDPWLVRGLRGINLKGIVEFARNDQGPEGGPDAELAAEILERCLEWYSNTVKALREQADAALTSASWQAELTERCRRVHAFGLLSSGAGQPHALLRTLQGLIRGGIEHAMESQLAEHARSMTSGEALHGILTQYLHEVVQATALLDLGQLEFSISAGPGSEDLSRTVRELWCTEAQRLVKAYVAAVVDAVERPARAGWLLIGPVAEANSWWHAGLLDALDVTCINTFSVSGFVFAPTPVAEFLCHGRTLGAVPLDPDEWVVAETASSLCRDAQPDRKAPLRDLNAAVAAARTLL